MSIIWINQHWKTFDSTNSTRQATIIYQDKRYKTGYIQKEEKTTRKHVFEAVIYDEPWYARHQGIQNNCNQYLNRLPKEND